MNLVEKHFDINDSKLREADIIHLHWIVDLKLLDSLRNLQKGTLVGARREKEVETLEALLHVRCFPAGVCARISYCALRIQDIHEAHAPT